MCAQCSLHSLHHGPQRLSHAKVHDTWVVIHFGQFRDLEADAPYKLCAGIRVGYHAQFMSQGKPSGITCPHTRRHAAVFKVDSHQLCCHVSTARHQRCTASTLSHVPYRP
jgi:hypothetical protein